MKKRLLLILISILVWIPDWVEAQNKKPKVALVLSGGGAKGIAHISTLQLLDSLGIVPDLIVGTSMGSIVGGFYAMGYSGDSIEKITNNTNWDVLFGGKTQLKNVGVEEKSEYGKYLVDFDLVKGRLKIKPALLNDQNLREFISTLSYPVYNVHNFDSLSIPFRAVTTDIVNGKEIVLKEGSVSYAMRASMSIPSIFLPVPYKETLLVDGGVLNNFPTDVAKSLGADIIIGSDVGGGMLPKEKLDNIAALAFQSGMLTSSLKNPGNRLLCDILIDHVPNITYTTGDFNKNKEIYNEGVIAVNQNKEALIALATKLKGFNQREHKLPVVPEKVLLDTIVFKGVSEADLDLVRERTALEPHKKYTPKEVSEGINKAMGTNLFSQIIYHPIINGNKIGLQLNGFEKAKHQIKGAIHYDNYRGVGLILNYTNRNIFGDASRFLLTLDIAEQPGFRMQYQKQFGEKKDWWWRSEVLGQNLIQNFYYEGERIDGLDYKYRVFDNQFNKNIHSLRSYFGLGAQYENTKLKPISDPEIVENVFGLSDYRFKNLDLYAHFMYNTMEDVFFSKKGLFFNAILSRSLLHHVDIDYYEESNEKQDQRGDTNGFTKVGFNFEERHVFHSNITGVLGLSSNFTFADQVEDEDIDFIKYGYGSFYSLGGSLIRPRKDDYIFPGLRDGEVVVTQFMMARLGVQIETARSLYITPHLNMASVGFDDFDTYIQDAFSPTGDWQLDETSLLLSSGMSVAYNSIMGPIFLDVSWVNNINKMRFMFGVGLNLNRSN